MKTVHKRNGKKRREITAIAKRVASSYRESESDKIPKVSVDWASYKMPEEIYIEEIDGKKVVSKIKPHYYDVCHLFWNGKQMVLKTPNDKRISDLEGIAYNLVEMVLFRTTPNQLAYRLGIELEKRGYYTTLDYSESKP